MAGGADGGAALRARGAAWRVRLGGRGAGVVGVHGSGVAEWGLVGQGEAVARPSLAEL